MLRRVDRRRGDEYDDSQSHSPVSAGDDGVDAHSLPANRLGNMRYRPLSSDAQRAFRWVGRAMDSYILDGLIMTLSAVVTASVDCSKFQPCSD